MISALLLGIIASLTLRPLHQTPSAEESREPADVFGTTDPQQGDEKLRAGDYQGALLVFRDLAAIQNPVTAHLRYRIALCLEGLTQWEAARTAYDEIAVRDLPVLSTSARVGKARVWFRQQNLVEAEQLLWDVVLGSARESPSAEPALAEARYLLGLTLSHKALQLAGAPAQGGARPESLPPDWLVENTLAWIPPAGSQSQSAPTATASEAPPLQPALTNGALDPAVWVSAGPLDLATVTISPQREQEDVVTLLGRVAQAGDLKLDWTDAARKRVQKHMVSVATQTMPLALLLEGLTERWGVVCDVDRTTARTWKIQSVDESPDALRDHRLRTAYNALEHARSKAPDHRWWQRRARLELGNLALFRGKLPDAIEHYGSICDKDNTDYTSSLINIVASHNLALVQTLKGDREGARRALFLVADGAPEHPLGAAALCQLGRMSLDAGDLPEALGTFGRVLSAPPSRELEAQAVLCQALARLLLGESREIAPLLGKHTEAYSRDRYRKAAAFLSEYARYQLLTNKPQRREEERLLGLLMFIDQDYQWLGAAGALVIGRAYRELGLPEEMARVYQQAREQMQPRGAIAREMQCALADHAYSSGDRATAVEAWRLLAAGTDRWATVAHLKLAEYDLEDGRLQDCLATCRELLQQHWPSPTVMPALTLMGRAYSQQKDYRLAALCYAGDGKAVLKERPSRP